MNFKTNDLKASNNDKTLGIWDVEDVEFSGYETVAPFYLFRLKEMMEWATEMWADQEHSDVDLVLAQKSSGACIAMVNRTTDEVMVGTPVDLNGPGLFEYIAMLDDDRETGQQDGQDGLPEESSSSDD